MESNPSKLPQTDYSDPAVIEKIIDSLRDRIAYNEDLKREYVVPVQLALMAYLQRLRIIHPQGLRERIAFVIGNDLGYSKEFWDTEWPKIDPSVKAKWLSMSDDILAAVAEQSFGGVTKFNRGDRVEHVEDGCIGTVSGYDKFDSGGFGYLVKWDNPPFEDGAMYDDTLLCSPMVDRPKPAEQAKQSPGDVPRLRAALDAIETIAANDKCGCPEMGAIIAECQMAEQDTKPTIHTRR